MGIVFLIVLAIGLAVYAIQVRKKNKQKSQPMHFDLLDDNGVPIKNSKVKVVVGGGDSDAPAQELQYFCIKDKGHHISVWPKNHDQFDIVQFNIAGMSHREGIDNYLGESIGMLVADPDNPYDANAIKVLATDGHHVGYVSRDMIAEVRKESELPCVCWFYIGCNDGTYFSECFVLRK